MIFYKDFFISRNQRAQAGLGGKFPWNFPPKGAYETRQEREGETTNEIDRRKFRLSFPPINRNFEFIRLGAFPAENRVTG